MPFSSPTTTSAVNENRRPPLTTLATRLISTTRSWRSRPAGLTLLSGTGMLVPEGSGGVLDSDRQAALAGALGQLADAAVVAVAAAVEHRALHAGGLGTLGQEAADALGLLHPAEVAHAGLGPGRRGHRATALVVDELGADAAVGAEDRDPGPLGRPPHLGPDAAAPPQPLHGLRRDGHARF